jgi:hypothetical protein
MCLTKLIQVDYKFSEIKMDNTKDYLYQRRQDAMSEMEEILAELEKLKGAYKIDSKHFEKMTELIVDKGLEIIQNYENIQGLDDSYKTTYVELEQLRKEQQSKK